MILVYIYIYIYIRTMIIQKVLRLTLKEKLSQSILLWKHSATYFETRKANSDLNVFLLKMFNMLMPITPTSATQLSPSLVFLHTTNLITVISNNIYHPVTLGCRI